MYVIVAIAAGVIAGLLMGGRFRHLSARSFRWAWLLVIGIGLQIALGLLALSSTSAYVALLASYAALAAFAVRNLTLRGMGVVAIGLALNLAPIAVNRSMPVKAEAIVRAHVATRAELATFHFSGKWHLAGPRDHLLVLSDIVPDWVFHEVLSFGDIVMAVGIAALLANMLRPTRRTAAAVGSVASVGSVA
jgi:hypothetical protein